MWKAQNQQKVSRSSCLLSNSVGLLSSVLFQPAWLTILCSIPKLFVVALAQSTFCKLTSLSSACHSTPTSTPTSTPAQNVFLLPLPPQSCSCLCISPSVGCRLCYNLFNALVYFRLVRSCWRAWLRRSQEGHILLVEWRTHTLSLCIK